MFDFLCLNPDYFGIDISDLSLKIIKLKKKRGLLALSSFGEKSIPKGIVDSGEIKDEESLAKIIKEAVRQTEGEKIKTKYAVCSLPEEKSYLQVIQIPKMQDDEIKNAVRFEAENYIPIPIDGAYMDFQVIKPVCDHLDHLDILIAALPKKIVDPYISVLRKAGTISLAMEIESLSIARALIKGGMNPFPVLIIDVGATRTSFIIFSGYSIRFTSSISTSSKDFTDAIARAMNVGLEEAEDLKRKYGIWGPPKVVLKEKTGDSTFEKEIAGDEKISACTKPILDDLMCKIKNHLDYYHAHFEHEHLPSNVNQVGKILLCGGGANLKGLKEFIMKEIKIKTEVGDPWVNISKCPLEMPFEKSLGFATAFGLAQRKEIYAP